MRVLFLAGACPYPPNSGGTVRTYNLLKQLCHRHEITLIAPSNARVDLGDAFGRKLRRVVAVTDPRGGVRHAMASLLSSLPYIVKAHENAAMAESVRSALAGDHFDILHCDSISAAEAIPKGVSLPKVFNAHNVEAVIWERYVSEERRPWVLPVLQSQLAKVRAYEARLPGMFDGCVTVSEEDRAQMRRRYGFENVGVVINGVDLDFYESQPDPNSPTLAFIGSLDWRPNQDGVRWLLGSIWPAIGSEVPEARLSLVGRRPPQWMSRLCDHSGVSLYADVPDIRPHLADAAIIVVPLRIGGGSRLKILEAMAAGRCVVSTTIGAEGLDVRDGEHLVIADEPAAFAREVVSLLRDRDRRVEIARAGRALVESEYGWEQAAWQMESAWTAAQRGITDDTHTATRV